MIAADSSVVVAALLDWHEAHEASRQAAQGAVIPAHALAETYSVLTRLPYHWLRRTPHAFWRLPSTMPGSFRHPAGSTWNYQRHALPPRSPAVVSTMLSSLSRQSNTEPRSCRATSARLGSMSGSAPRSPGCSPALRGRSNELPGKRPRMPRRQPGHPQWPGSRRRRRSGCRRGTRSRRRTPADTRPPW